MFCCFAAAGDESAEGKDGGGGAVQQKFRIPSSEVYNELMVSKLLSSFMPVLVFVLPLFYFFISPLFYVVFV